MKLSTRAKLAFIATAAVNLCVCLYVAGKSGFFVDDIVNLHVAQTCPALSCVLIPNFEHLGIGQRILNVLIFGRKHGYWGSAMSVMAALNLLVTYQAFRVMRLLCGSPSWSIVVALLCGSNVLWLTSWSWWASASDSVLTVPAMFLVLENGIRCARGVHWSRILAICCALLIACMSRERPVLMPIGLALLAIFLEDNRLSWTLIGRVLFRLRHVWLGCAAVIVAYLAFLYFGQFLRSYLPGAAQSQGSVATGVGAFAAFVSKGFFATLVPALFGILPDAFPPNWHVVPGANLLLVLLCVGSVWISPRTWRAWFFLTILGALMIVPVAIARGSSISYASILIYYPEILPYVVVALGLMARALAMVPGSLAKKRLLPQFGATGVAVILGCTVWSTVHFLEHDWFVHNRGLTARLLREHLSEVPVGPNDTVMEAMLPKDVDWASSPPGRHSLISTWARRTGNFFSIQTSSSERLWFVQSDGRVQGFTRSSERIVSPFSLILDPPAAQANVAGDLCFTAHDELAVSVPMEKFPGPHWMRIVWEGQGPDYLIPLPDENDARLIPGAMSPYPAGIFCPEGAKRCGFILPKSSGACLQEIRVTALEPLPQGHDEDRAGKRRFLSMRSSPQQ